ncbi:disulfide bond formation protein B [Sphingomonas hengshuiensis]|uniref:Disulfide bond formation protein n=1 Tax=Sphingomonas hengshuiensis TaxID=1609977 RepID=A0A7U4JAM4_9SPHN|nr:disulfide bond formation protein B [Sphingomonas hengshuiensis]AJP73345.1 disulfide bond formation protein [Sphingomonas hengshuiensis]
MPVDGLRIARLIALLLPAALVGGALLSQSFGLVPCEMCMWQRWPHYAAIAVAALSFVAPGRPLRMTLVLFAGALIALSGAIGIFHAGVEYHWWQGITACTAAATPGDPMAMLDEALRRPLIRCDTAQWTLLGISLAGFNAIFSLAGAVAIFGLSVRRARR